MKKANIISKAINDVKALRDDRIATNMIINDIQNAFWNRHKKAAVVFGVATILVSALQITSCIIEAVDEVKKNKELIDNDNEENRG